MLKNKKGQSTIEYVLLATAVVAVLIAFLGTNKDSPFGGKLNDTLDTTTEGMKTMSDRFNEQWNGNGGGSNGGGNGGGS